MGKEQQSRILVIDDDKNIQKVLTSILKDKDYTVETAGTGAEAVAKASRGQFDLLLIDIRLPDMEGTELITRIHDTTPKMRKVMVTGYPTLHNAIAAVNKGADAYVMKPFDVEKLLLTIKDQLEEQKQDRNYTEANVTDFIKTRVKELNPNIKA